MKQKFLFLSFLFFVNDFCNGQDSTLAKWSVNISPSLLNIPPVDLGIQFGVQYRGGDWGFGAELAFPFQKSNEHYTEMKYRRWGAELKRFLGREKQNYLSLQFNYAQRNFRDSSPGRFFRSTVADAYDYRSTSISSPIVNTAFKFGREMEIGKKFFVDCFAGLGVGVIMTEYKNIEGLETVDRTNLFAHFSIYSAHRYDKTIKRLHATAGARLHYYF